MSSPEDHTPHDFALPHGGIVERFVKRPVRRFTYPVYKVATSTWLAHRYGKECPFPVDHWLWGQRGNDFDAHRRRVDRILPLRGKQILIAGCGTGRDIPSWLPYQPQKVIGIDYFGYDRAWSMVRDDAKSSYPETRLAFLQGDLSHLPQIDDASIDVVGSDAVFEHVRELAPVVREFHRILKPGGLMYATFGPLWYTWGGDHVSG